MWTVYELMFVLLCMAVCGVHPHVLCERQISKYEFCTRNAMWTVQNSHFWFVPVAAVHVS